MGIKFTKIPVITAILVMNMHFASSQDLSRSLDSLMNKYVSEGKLHGCVTLVQQGDKVLHFKSYGYSDIEENIKMQNTAIFDIASMSKPITAAGALKLYDEGRFSLDDPVKKYLPELSGLKVLEKATDGSCRTVLPVRDVTVKDLFCHTAGFGYGWSKDTIDRLYRKGNLDAVNQTPESFLKILGGIPLKFQPGEKWEYSISIDILGLMIERITGEKLDRILKEEIFTPLKMKSTGFYISAENEGRLSSSYVYVNGRLEKQYYPLPLEYSVVPEMFRGGGGLVSTARDLARFCEMILNEGSFRGKQVLKPETVKMMITDQIAGISERSFDVPGYGLGIGVLPDDQGAGTRMVYWSGSPFNTNFFIDFEKQITGIFLTQNGPFGHLEIREKFMETVENHTH